MDEPLDYRKAGVNLDAAEQSVEAIKKLARSTYRPEVIQDIGGFSGLFSLNKEKYRNPVLVSGTDGVGTKLKIAFTLDKHDTVGEDCVAMCVNDLLVQGAEPLFFLDYLAVGEMQNSRVEEIIRGVARGCQKAGCALLGGETAEMPGFYSPGEYDLAGFTVGIVEKDNIINGARIDAGDRVIGIASSGLHSNGFSLVRRIIEDKGISLKDPVEAGGNSLGEELLKPTLIYVKPVLSLLENYRVKGMANITGGGIPGNLKRILPAGLTASIDPGSWPIPEVFRYLQEKGNVKEEEMFNVFNMGIGYILVIPGDSADEANHFINKELSLNSYIIGEIVKGENGDNAEVYIRGGEQ